MSFKIKTFGWRNQNLDQISRIEQALISLGHQIVEENPDFIYSHDFTEIDKAYEFKQKYPNTKYLQKVLDLPIHLFNTQFFDLNKTKEKLTRADLILSNSQTVKNNIKNYLNLDSYVVYDAIKDVSNLNSKKDIPFLYVGRANDPNKRFSLIKDFFNLTEFDKNKLIVVGPDNPSFGTYKGVVDDFTLNDLYNRSKYIIFPSFIEGIGLPPIEASICKCIPILSNDNQTALEFWNFKLTCDPNAYSIAGKILEIENNYNYYLDIARNHAKDYISFFDKLTIAQNITNAFNVLK